MVNEAADLASTGSSGLSSAQATRLLVQLGPNEVESGRRFSALRSLLSLFLNPLVLILLVACRQPDLQPQMKKSS